MQYHIKEWSDQTASLVAEEGYSLDVFASIGEAIDDCLYDCQVESEYIEKYNNYPGSSPLDFEASAV